MAWECWLAIDDRENLFVSIYQDGTEWAEVYPDTDNGRFVLTIFPAHEGAWHVFPLDEVEESIREARRRLEERGYPARPEPASGLEDATEP